MPKDANGLEIVTYLLATDPVRFDVTNVPTNNLETRDNDLLERLEVRDANLPANPGFESGPTTLFSNPADSTIILDPWTSQGLSGAGCEAQKETTLTNNSDGAIRIKTVTAASGRIEQSLPSSTYKALRGKKVTLSVDARYLTTNGEMRIQINDGIGSSTFTSTSLSTTYQRFTIERTIDVAASQLLIRLFGNDGVTTTAETLFDNVSFVTGSYPQGAVFLIGGTVDTSAFVTSVSNTPNRDTFTASAAQTLFNLSFSYTLAGKEIEVYKNGILQKLTTDYAETSTTSITLAVGAELNDIIEVVKPVTLTVT